MFLRVAELESKKLVGHSIRMSLVTNKTFELWSNFMPRRKEIDNTVHSELYSLQVYDSLVYFNAFNPSALFTKWALVEVSNFDSIPEGMESFTLESGIYAVFKHKGMSQEFPKTMAYIFNEWLPSSDYVLDHRPHFEILGDKYKKDSPDSEEEVWIPIKVK